MTERVLNIVSDAGDEVVLVVLDEQVFDEEFVDYLGDEIDRGVTVSIDALSDEVRERVEDGSF